MDIKEQEKSEKKTGITKSQKRHMKKVEKRKAKKNLRKEKQKREQEASGKLIEENHNGGLYSAEFTKKAVTWYVGELVKLCQNSGGDPDRFLIGFRGLRPKLQTTLLKWSDDLERTGEFWFFKELLDRYRNNKEDGMGLYEYSNEILTIQGFL